MRFTENIIDEIKSDDEAADSEYEASTELADSDGMETDTQNEANDEPELFTESPPARASARLTGLKAVGQGRAC